MKNRLILITGPKHSGKSVTALALGKITGAEAVDLDEIVERQNHKSPRELFKEGPELFRKAEALALASLVDGGNTSRLTIIAAGGGLVDNAEALAILSRHGEAITVYLDVSSETAWQRILSTSAVGELPPFLNTENPRETHLALHKRRAEAYKALAQIAILGDDKSPEEIAEEIARRLPPGFFEES
jgi:shikimate kinase